LLRVSSSESRFGFFVSGITDDAHGEPPVRDAGQALSNALAAPFAMP
jgi:hypothetical protein